MTTESPIKTSTETVSVMCAENKFEGLPGGNPRYLSADAFLDTSSHVLIRGLANVFFNYSRGTELAVGAGLGPQELAKAHSILDRYLNYTPESTDLIRILPVNEAIVYNAMLSGMITAIPPSASPKVVLGIAANAYLTVAWNFIRQYSGLDDDHLIMSGICQKLMTYYWNP